MKPKNYLQLAALTLGMAMTVIMSSCAKEDNPANVPAYTTGGVLNLSEINVANVPITAEGWRELVVSDGLTLTGKLRDDVRLFIADGATVTLSGVDINGDGTLDGSHAGITCLGNAHILLSENTVNKVRGFNVTSPGIQISAGSTISIDGGGLLNPDENVFSAGIGIGIGIDWNDGTPVVGSAGDSPVLEASPLYVVDGIAVDGFPNIRYEDIRTIEVRNDAASAAIYGAQAANGVILVTTAKVNPAIL